MENIFRFFNMIRLVDDDPRAGVIANPRAAFFTESRFADVAAPIQLRASERGGDGLTLESALP